MRVLREALEAVERREAAAVRGPTTVREPATVRAPASVREPATVREPAVAAAEVSRPVSVPGSVPAQGPAASRVAAGEDDVTHRGDVATGLVDVAREGDVATRQANVALDGDVASQDGWASHDGWASEGEVADERWLAAANWPALSLGQESPRFTDSAAYEASPERVAERDDPLLSAVEVEESLSDIRSDPDRPDDPCREARRARRRHSLDRGPSSLDSFASRHAADPLTYDWELAARLTGRDVGPATAAGAALRGWRDRVLADLADRLPAMVLVTSATPREGVSESVLGLAMWLAESGSVQPLVVDAAPRRPGIADRLWSGQHVGLGELLAGQAEWHEAVVPLPELGLSLLPAGRAVHAAQRVAPGAGLAAVGRRLVERQRLVLVDAGPIAEAAALEWARLAEATYLVVRLGVAREAGTIEALDRLHGCGARVLGAVVIGGLVGSAQQA